MSSAFFLKLVVRCCGPTRFEKICLMSAAFITALVAHVVFWSVVAGRPRTIDPEGRRW